jgi:hypothetical protein
MPNERLRHKLLMKARRHPRGSARVTVRVPVTESAIAVVTEVVKRAVRIRVRVGRDQTTRRVENCVRNDMRFSVRSF